MAQQMALKQAHIAACLIRDGLKEQREQLVGSVVVLDRQLVEAMRACDELANLLKLIKTTKTSARRRQTKRKGR